MAFTDKSTEGTVIYDPTQIGMGVNNQKFTSIMTSGTTWESGDIVQPNATITLGKYSIDEDMLEKLSIVLEIMEEDPEWADRIKTQQAFNKLKGE